MKRHEDKSTRTEEGEGVSRRPWSVAAGRICSGRYRAAASPDPVPIATSEIHDHDGEHPIAASDAPSPSEAPLASATRPASETLDSGDTNAFSSLEAGAIACGRDLHPHEQGQIVAAR